MWGLLSNAGPGAPILLAQNSDSYAARDASWVWCYLAEMVPFSLVLLFMVRLVPRVGAVNPALPLTCCVTLGSRGLSPCPLSLNCTVGFSPIHWEGWFQQRASLGSLTPFCALQFFSNKPAPHLQDGVPASLWLTWARL